MNAWVTYLILPVVPAPTRPARFVRPRGGGGGLLAAYEEAFRAVGHLARHEAGPRGGSRWTW